MAWTQVDAQPTGSAGRLAERALDAETPLLPRYRRLLDFSAVLDETFRIFRQAWVPALLLMAIGGVANVLIDVLLRATGVVVTPVAPTAGVNSALALTQMRDYLGPLYLFVFVAGLVRAWVLLPPAIGVILTATLVMRGVRPTAASVWPLLRRGIGCWPPAIGLGVIAFVTVLLLCVPATALFVLDVFVVGLLAAVIGLVVWLAKPRARRPWLKWLIVLSTPFGLPIYFSGKWYLGLVAIALEGAGPVAALRRSGTLVAGHWFRAFGVVAVLGFIVGLLQAIPTTILGGILAAMQIGAIARGGPAAVSQPGLGVSVVSAAVGSLGLVLFGALPFIGMTLLYVDLRNRHEGADLAERLQQIDRAAGSNVAAGAESVPGAASGAL